MKSCPTMFVMALVSVGVCFGGIEKGMTRDEVVAELGGPSGLISAKDYELLDYERGRVELREGEVVSFHLISEEELERQREREAERKAAEARRKKKLRKRRYEEGMELKEKMFSSPKYLEKSGKEKVAVLKRFHSKYPRVDISELVDTALEQKKNESLIAEKKRRLDRLEKRVQEAEKKAQRAEWRAVQAESDAQNAWRNRYYLDRFHRRKYESDYQPGNFGLSVGCETPGLTIHYRNGTRHYRQRDFGVNAVSGERLRSTSSTVRFNDGL